MQKVGFFQSIHFKIALVYVLLLLVAMQVIGVYFTHQLERELKTNFKNEIMTRARGISFNVEELLKQSSLGNDGELKTKMNTLLEKNSTANEDLKIQVISPNQVLLGTSESSNYNNV